jgi:pyruvate formate lyase activating enzyme
MSLTAPSTGHDDVRINFCTSRKWSTMTPEEIKQPGSLESGSPFELRVNKGSKVSESVIKEALDSGDMGFIHSFTTGSAVDGPGMRVVAWLAGCQFRCLYCHNPDTWSLNHGTPVSLPRAIEELRKYRQGLNVMSGGVTLSGGEPLMQDRFAIRLFAAAKVLGVHTALDTNGFLGARLSDDELERIDLVLLDIKAWDAEHHRYLTGKDVNPVLEFARRLAARKRRCWLRFVLVPALTDDPQDIAQIAKFAAGLGNIERVDVLPFHQMGRYKWKELGHNYTLHNTESPDHELIQRVCAQFAMEGLKVY